MKFRKTVFALLVMVLFTGIGTASAATIAVNTTADELNTNGQCSLREAITNINNGANTYSDCAPTGSGYGTSDTINIPAGTYTTTTSSYNIAKNVSLVGAGAGTTTINGGGLDRVFYITGTYTVSFSGVTITGASVPSFGGGIYMAGVGTLTVTDSTISNNTAGNGGGISSGNFVGGTVNVTNSTISNNTATWDGGGIHSYTTLNVTNSTITGNTSVGWTGGGIVNGGHLALTNSTITGNSALGGSGGSGIYAGTLTATNSIVANQTMGEDCVGVITTSGGYNLESATSCGFTGTGDMQNTDPLLGLLQDNGGPTFTYALLEGSPAINIIPNGVNGCGTTITTDQRGVSRPQPSGGSCDMGAFEVELNCVQPPSGMVSWWGGDNNALDIVGSNNGTLMNGATFASGKVGQAFSFDGVDDYVSVPPAAGIINNGPGTVELWFKANAIPSTGNYGYLYTQSNSSTGADIRIYLYGNNTLNFVGYNGSSYEFNLSTPFSDTSSWHHVVGTWSATDTRFYVDNVLIGSNSNINMGAFVPDTINIGAELYPNRYFNGLIDEVGLFNRALSADEIAAIYNAGSAGVCVPYVLTVNKDGTGSGNVTGDVTGVQENGINCGSDCTESYSYNTVVTLTATPATDSTFTGWSGDCNSSGEVMMTGTKTCTATFTLNTYTVTTNATSGSITSTNNPTVNHGDTTTVEGSANANYYFTGVTGCGGTPQSNTNQSITTFSYTTGAITGDCTVSATFTLMQCVAPPSGMVSWWGGENNALDMVGANNGTVMADVTYAPGKVGQAFSFDGTANSYVEIADHPSLNPVDAFTVDGWFYIDPGAPGNIGGEASLVAKTYGGVGDGGWFLWFQDSAAYTKALRFDILTWGSPAWPFAEVNNIIMSAGWYHIAGVFDLASDPQAKLYVNGALAASSTSTISAILNNSLPIRIGASHWGAGDRFNGKADEVEYFNRALSASEIAGIYNAGSAGKCVPYVLTVNKDGTGSGNVTGDVAGVQGSGINCGTDCTESYSYNTVVTLTPTPATGSTFTGWSGDCNSSGEVTMTATKTCTATFTLNTYTVTTTATNGLITSTVNPIVNHGDTTTVEGAANANYYFTDVSGCGGTPQSNTNQSITTFSYTTGAITGDCTVSATFTLMQCVAPPSGMVSWWKGEDNANDSIGGNNGTLMDGATFAPGKVGQAFSFDGVDDSVAIPNGIVPNTSRNFTVDAWAFPDIVEVNQRIIIDGGSIGGAYQLGVSNNNYLFKIKLNNGNWYETTSPAAAGVWAFVAGIRRGTSIELWVDGLLKSSTGIPDLNLWAVGGTTYNARIGSSNISTVNIELWDGLIDEVEIFNRALSADEIASIYNADSAGKCVPYVLTVNKDGTGSGNVTGDVTGVQGSGINCGSDCTESYTYNTVVTLTATPASGSYFTGWSGDADCSDGSVTMSADITCTATFDEYTSFALFTDSFSNHNYADQWDVSNAGTVSMTEGSATLKVLITKPLSGCSYADLRSKQTFDGENLLVETGVRIEGNGEMRLRLKKDDNNFVQFGIKEFGPDGLPDFIIGSSENSTYTEQALDLTAEYALKKKYKYKTFSIVKTGDEYRAYLNGMDTGGEVTNALVGDAGLKVELLNGVCSTELKGTNNYFDYVFVSETVDGSIPATDLKLLTPNGGEAIKIGSIYLVLWEGPAGASYYSIDYSVNGGLNWIMLDSAVEGKFYTWKLQKENPYTTYKLRVKAHDSIGAVIDSDASDTNFTVQY